jgi:uncharacterized protein (DUF305 family)
MLRSQHLNRLLIGIGIAALSLFSTTFAVSRVVADAPTEGRAGRAEVRFLQGMIDHHQMALDMANHCIAKEDIGDEIRALCQQVVDAQSPEIEMMRTWLLEWYNIEYTPMSMLASHDGEQSSGGEHGGMMGGDHSQHSGTPDASAAAEHSGDHSQHGGTPNTSAPFTDPAMTMGMMAGLNRVSGVEYEVAWLESMIDHHDDAIHMADRILVRAEHPELTQLAQAIIRDQSAEIELMEQLINARAN